MNLIQKIKKSFDYIWVEVPVTNIISLRSIHHTDGNSSIVEYEYEGAIRSKHVSVEYKRELIEPKLYTQTNPGMNTADRLVLPLSHLLK